MKEAELHQVERALMGSVLLDCSGGSTRCLTMAVNEGVEPDWFTNKALALAWLAVRLIWSENGGVDAITVIERARRIAAEPKSPFAAEASGIVVEIQGALDDTPTTAHFEHYLAIARAEVMFRRVERANTAFAKSVREGSEVSQAVQDFSRRIVQILSGSMASKVISLQDTLKKIEDEYLFANRKRCVEHDLEYTPGHPLPWRKFNIASQGVQEGLVYIGARPSVGKTAFVLNLIRYWCESGVKVCVNSLDMAIKPMMKRPIGEVSRVSFAKSSFGTTTHDDLDSIHTAIWGEKDESGAIVKRGIVDWPLTLVQERNVDSFRSWCIAMRQLGKLDIVVIDFVQLMGTKARYTNDNEKLEYISGVLKSIAIDLDIPVLALSQLNRACEEDGGRVPTASDLRGSGALEQDATAVWILHNDRDVQKTWFAKDEQGKLSNMPVGLTMNRTSDEFKGIAPVRLIIAKNQNGQAGQDVWFPMVFFKKYCLFMLGDPDAACPTRTVGYGVSSKQMTDYSPMYARVTHDWRNDPFEIVLRKHGCLIGGDVTQGGFQI